MLLTRMFRNIRNKDLKLLRGLLLIVVYYFGIFSFNLKITC